MTDERSNWIIIDDALQAWTGNSLTAAAEVEAALVAAGRLHNEGAMQATYNHGYVTGYKKAIENEAAAGRLLTPEHERGAL